MLQESEQDTVVKRVLPYMRRRGYSDLTDLEFEVGMKLSTRYAQGYADILVTCGKTSPQFVVEAKKSSKNLTVNDTKQAIEYGRTKKTPFVVVTNGQTIRCYNTANGEPLLWNGKLADKMPSRDQLPKLISALKSNPNLTNVQFNDAVSPFQPSLPLKQLNALFKRCHNAIRKIEKNEESAFADFSKILFLKLLEEKEDSGLFKLPYTYRFHELAEKTSEEADQVETAILRMLDKIKTDFDYGDVLGDPIKLKSSRTYQYIVKALGNVYISDSNLDAKGAAFEYFVRATLKGKKLGQYFTPRPLIEYMSSLCGTRKVIHAVLSGANIKVLDPACGTGGFLVFLLNRSVEQLSVLLQTNQITESTYQSLLKRLKGSTFYGSDANHGVACSAKMNMIVAGDGHTNILPENSLSIVSRNWNLETPDCDLILTNPPFGTSESESLTKDDRAAFKVKSSKGQNLFLQKMVLTLKPGGEICTVIDEGLLNTDTGASLRKWLLQHTSIVAIVRLPEETFKPNKINVRSSVLYLRKRKEIDFDLEAQYGITFVDLQSLGYDASGDMIRNFQMTKLLQEAGSDVLDVTKGPTRSGYHWKAFNVPSSDLHADPFFRMDLKYWNPEVRIRVADLLKAGGKTVRQLNVIKTARGKSPNADLYVDEGDGYAAVLKAGSSINKFGEVRPGKDYIEEDLFQSIPKRALVQPGDVLVASTGDGTLGKCGVYVGSLPAIADGHVSIIRPDPTVVDPYYLADYLRLGFGAKQVERLYTGATGLIELTEDRIDQIVIDTLGDDVQMQQQRSKDLRSSEKKFRKDLQETRTALDQAVEAFGKH